MANMRVTYGCSPLDINHRDTDYDTSETPKNELTNGIQHIYISSYGDDTSAFVKVTALTDEIGTKAYTAVWKTLTNDVFKQWYGVE